MKQKTRKLSIRYKIILPSTFLIILVCLIIGGNSYARIQNSMIEMAVEEASLAAKFAAKSVNSAWIPEIVPGAEGTSVYNLLLKRLSSLKEECGMLYMYTVYLENGQSYYGLDSDESENHCMVGEEFDTAYEVLLPVLSGEIVSTNEIEKEGNEYLLTVYAPIYDDNQEIVGILGCDYNAEGAVDKINGTIKRVVAISLICMILAIIIMNIIIQAIMKNLTLINQKIYDLVNNEGDLTQTLDVTSGDETELIAENINSLLNYMHGIMRNISENSANINTSSDKMVDSISDAELNITDVSATMEQMSAAMQETSASMNQITESVSQIYQQVENIYSKSKDGMDYTNRSRTNASEIRNKAVESQDDAKKQVEQMTAVMNEKIEHSKAVQEISELTENIINITEQTNLLSLNASIEAARAGEAGKGFAVVADEIGKLANSSAEAAEKIRQVSSEVITAVSELSKEAEAMVSFVNEITMSGYENLVDTSGNYKDDAGSFYDMMDEFSKTARDLQQNMDSIKEAVGAVNIAVEESAKGITNVSEMSVNLTEIVNSISDEAQGNQEIAGHLNSEVGKFKI